MSKAAPRLPVSFTEFALPPPSNLVPSNPAAPDEPNYAFQRLRRQSILTPKATHFSETRLHSPLASSFTGQSREPSTSVNEESESVTDNRRMSTGSSSGSSSDPSPLAKITNPNPKEKQTHSKPPLTPPRKSSLTFRTMSLQDLTSPFPGRRCSFPIKPPRILNLRAESRPEENEVKSEAAFQRLIASGSELPVHPRTPRPVTDRGRYPEEAGREDTRQDSSSDDEDDFTEALDVSKTDLVTINGGTIPMDVDTPFGSPSASSIISTSTNGWRYTPPPTSSAIRSTKRKLDDRFDPYPSIAKRRAVSPSLASLKDSFGSPMNSRNPRLPISIPINIPSSVVNSASPSPIICGSYPGSFSRSVSISSSPTIRSSMLLASPILRPVPRINKKGDEKEIDGAGEAVSGLTIV